MKRIFSGVQPSGQLHLGNYLGAIRNWVAMQEEGKKVNASNLSLLFSIVDLHAITVPQEPKKLHDSILSTAAALLSCGLSPDHCTMYVQSAVREHAHLSWILACQTPMGWLNRMTQFKDKSKGSGDRSGLGLYSYPVLMSADILLYQYVSANFPSPDV